MTLTATREPHIASAHRMAVLMAVLAATPNLAGCLGPDAANQYYVTYLGDDVKERAIELEDDEIKDRFPELASAMREAREKGPGTPVYALASDELAEWLTAEGREQWNGSEAYASDHVIYDRFENRVNWTGSTFQLESDAA